MRIERLENIANIIAGQSPPSSTYNNDGNGLPFFQGKADFGQIYPQVRTWCTEPLKIAEPNDILISVRAPVGPTNITNIKSAIGRGLSAIRAGKEIDFKFLFHFLRFYEPKFAGKTRGSTFDSITQEDLKKIQVPLPDLQTQQQIVAVLDKAQSIIDKRKDSLQLLDKLLRDTFLNMFGDPVSNLKKWPTGIIKDLVESVNYGTSEKSADKGKYPYIRMNNVTYEGYFDFSDLKYINADKNSLEKFGLKNGDLVFNRTNSKDLVGKTAVYKGNDDVIIAGYLIRIRTNTKANSDYISGYLNSIHGKATLKNMCKNIIGMANINAQELQGINILIPPVSVQNKYSKVVDQQQELRKKLNSNLQQIETLFQSLLQKAFKGELEMQISVEERIKKGLSILRNAKEKKQETQEISEKNLYSNQKIEQPELITAGKPEKKEPPLEETDIRKEDKDEQYEPKYLTLEEQKKYIDWDTIEEPLEKMLKGSTEDDPVSFSVLKNWPVAQRTEATGFWNKAANWLSDGFNAVGKEMDKHREGMQQALYAGLRNFIRIEFATQSFTFTELKERLIREWFYPAFDLLSDFTMEELESDSGCLIQFFPGDEFLSAGNQGNNYRPSNGLEKKIYLTYKQHT